MSPTVLLFWAPLCLVAGAKKYFFGALYKNSDEQDAAFSGEQAEEKQELKQEAEAEVEEELAEMEEDVTGCKLRFKWHTL